MPLRVLIADDDQGFRTWLRAVLESEGFLVAEAPDGVAAVALANAARPDLALLDLAMPGADGIEVGRSIRASCPETRLVLLTGDSRAHQIAAAFRSGFRGYVVKTDAADGLLRAIRDVSAGRIFLSPAASRAVIETCAMELVPALDR